MSCRLDVNLMDKCVWWRAGNATNILANVSEGLCWWKEKKEEEEVIR